MLGHNGMGKTTLIKTLIGQVPLTGGTIKFAGADIGTIPSFRRARAGMGYMPQGRAIFPNLTVYENLRMGFIENGVNSRRTSSMTCWRGFLGSIHCSVAKAPLCPEVSSKSWRSRAVFAASRSFYCWTSRPKESSLRSWKKSWKS